MNGKIDKTLQFSIVIPVLNEEDNIAPLILELEQVLQEQDSFEVIFVDDHSTDQTPEILQLHKDTYTWLKVVRLCRQSGQSAALHYGVKKATAPLIVTLDGDGQNDPADIVQLIDVYHRVRKQNTCCLINGYRAQRKDSGWRCFSSSVANLIRSRLLKDDTPDSGCGIKAFPREIFLALPSFNHMHRFIPALIRQQGGKVISVAVNHRTRKSGKSHYGTLDRLSAGILDLLGVLWLGKRTIRCDLLKEKQHG